MPVGINPGYYRVLLLTYQLSVLVQYISDIHHRWHTIIVIATPIWAEVSTDLSAQVSKKAILRVIGG